MILIVDDDRRVAEALRAVLAAEGYETELAKDGFEALERLALPQCSCMLLDINMPQLDGIELLSLMREQNMTTPAIVMTGMADFDRSQLSPFPNVVHFLIKPVDTRHIVDVVREHAEQNVRVELMTTLRRVTGDLRLPRGQTLRGLLAAPPVFIQLENAEVQDADGIAMLSTGTVSVNSNHVVALSEIAQRPSATGS